MVLMVVVQTTMIVVENYDCDGDGRKGGEKDAVQNKEAVMVARVVRKSQRVPEAK